MDSILKKVQKKYFFQEFCNLPDFPYAVIKGEALSIQAYGREGYRNGMDIDILIPRNYLCDIEEFLLFIGFSNTQQSRRDRITMLSTSHQTAPWIKIYDPWGPIILDLNFDIFWGEYEGKRIDICEFLSDTIDINIYGSNLKTLPPIKAFVQLVLHNYKDLNSIFLLSTRNAIKHNAFQDIYFLLKNNNISAEKLYMVSNQYGIIPYVFYMLYYTGEIFKDSILNYYIDVFRTQDGEKLLDCYGLCANERRRWKYDFRTRYQSNDILSLIENDLTEKDKEKIAINKRIFMGQQE